MSDAATALREPWPDLEHQREGVTVGIWLFIASEVLFFGALFLGYTVYRTLYPEAHSRSPNRGVLRQREPLLLLTSNAAVTIAVDASMRHGAHIGVVIFHPGDSS